MEEKILRIEELQNNEHILKVKFSITTDNFVSCNKIVIETNMFSILDVAKIFSKNDIVYKIDNNTIKLLSKQCKNLNLDLNLNFRSSVNIFEIKGYYNFIEKFHDTLLEKLNSEFLFIEKKKILNEIIELISNLNENILKIKLYKFIPFNIAVKLKNNNIKTVNDIKFLDVSILYLSDLETIKNCFKIKITEHPKAIFDNLIQNLDDRQIDVVYKRAYMTLEEISKYYGCTRERIRQIEKKTIEKMSKNLLRFDLYDSVILYSDNFLYFTPEKINELGVSFYLVNKICEDRAFCETEQSGKIYFSGIEEKEIFEFFFENMPDFLDIPQKKKYVKEIVTALSDVNKAYYFAASEVEELIDLYYKFNYGSFNTKYRMPKVHLFPKIVAEYFKDGMDIYDPETLTQFKDIAYKYFNINIYDSTNRSIASVLQDCLKLKDRGFYYYNEDNSCLITEEIKNKIEIHIKNSKNPVISYKEIFELFQEELASIDIDNRYFLAAQIKLINIPGVNYSRDYIYKGDFTSVTDIYKDVESYITMSKELVTRDLLEKKFPFIKYTTFQNLLNNTGIINMNGYFSTIKKLNISKEEDIIIKRSLSEIICNNKIYHAKEVFRKSKKYLDNFFGRNGIDHYLKFYYIISKLYPKKYIYNRPYIATLDTIMKSGVQQLIERIIESKTCSIYGDIKFYAQDIGYYIDSYLDFVNTNNDSIVFVDQNNVITLSEAGISDELFENIDSILDIYMDDSEYKTLSQFHLNWKLPKIKIQWNEWVLASIINKYSDKYYIMYSCNTLSEAYPIIVSNDIDEESVDISKLKHIKSNIYEFEFDLDDL